MPCVHSVFYLQTGDTRNGKPYRARWKTCSPRTASTVVKLSVVEVKERSGCFATHYVSPAKQHIPGVEPRGFEPLTSAVQRRTAHILSCPTTSHCLVYSRGSWSLRSVSHPIAYHPVPARLQYGCSILYCRGLTAEGSRQGARGQLSLVLLVDGEIEDSPGRVDGEAHFEERVRPRLRP